MYVFIYFLLNQKMKITYPEQSKIETGLGIKCKITGRSTSQSF